jgi:Bacterial protein of unknown function (DUF937)
MAVNLVALVSQLLTPDLIATIARALGLDSSVAGKALAAAVPGLLGSLAGTASTQDGARKVFDAVTSQRPGTLEGLASALTSGSKDTLVQNGSSLLSSLLGGSAVTALAGAIGKYAGLGGGTGSSLLALLAPVVMGALGRQKTESGLDASGLSRLLTAQKDNIAAALPTGVADALRSAGVPGFSGVTTAAAQAARVAQSDIAQAAAPARSGLPSAALWIIPLLAVIAAALWFLSRPGEVADRTANVQNNLTVGNVDIGSTLKSTLGGVKTTLQNVTDAASAQAALPKLQDASAQLDKLDGLAAQLPAAGKTALAALIAAERPAIDELLNKVLALPGVAAIAKPAIDQFRGKLDALARA